PIYDDLSHALDESIENGMEIYVDVARPVKVTIDGEETIYETTATTVGDFLELEEIEINKYDEVSVSNIKLIEEDLEISIKRAFPIELTDGADDTEEAWAIKGNTVEEVLEKNDIKQKKYNKVSPKLSKKEKKDTEIDVTRVKEKEEEVEEAVSFKTVEKEDSSLEKGKTKVTKQGKEGKVKKTYNVTYENGEEVARDVIDEETITKSVDKEVAVGTKEVETASTSSTSEPSGGGKTMQMEATAY